MGAVIWNLLDGRLSLVLFQHLRVAGLEARIHFGPARTDLRIGHGWLSWEVRPALNYLKEELQLVMVEPHGELGPRCPYAGRVETAGL